MKLLYGTTNPAKLNSMRRITDSLGIELIGLRELSSSVPPVEETGKEPLENARLKAKAYQKAFSMSVFSCDSGLYFDELPESEQPGTHVRRVNGKELTDAEMTAHYAALAAKHGGRLTGRYRNAISLVTADGRCFESTDDSLMTEPFWLTDTPHEKRVEGFPLDRLSVDPLTGKYYYDLENHAVDQSAIEQGFGAFFEQVLAVLSKTE